MNKQETQTAICINDKTERDKRIKTLGITEGKEYQVKPSKYANYYELVNDLGQVETYFMDRFKIVKTPGEKIQEFHKNNKTWFQEAMEKVQPKVKEQLQKAINNYLEGDKMEDKTIKVRCIENGNMEHEALKIGNVYDAMESEYIKGAYQILIDDTGRKNMNFSKNWFEIVEDVLMVECVDTGLYEDITKEKQYKVIEEERSMYYIHNDYEVGKTYPKNLFKPIEPQKEIKEYSVMEVLQMPKGTILKLFPYDESEGRVIVSEGVNKNKYLYYIDDEGCHEEGVIISNWIMDKPRFIKVEEPKPVTTAEAFKALEEGKIIESLKSGDKYRKQNGLICAKNLDVYLRTNLIYGSELEGQWIIIEGDK